MLKFCMLYYCKSLSIYQKSTALLRFLKKWYYTEFFYILLIARLYVLSKKVIKKIGITVFPFQLDKAIGYLKVVFVRVSYHSNELCVAKTAIMYMLYIHFIA
jgi:hypothetical protein